MFLYKSLRLFGYNFQKGITMKKLTNTEFIEKARAKHGSYSYEKTVYVNSATKVTITCPIHGDFEQRPNDHLKGCGCTSCGVAAKTKSQIRFVEEAAKQHSSKYSYLNTVYVNAYTKVTITCPIHGDFEQIPYEHLRKSEGCPKCSGKASGFDKTKSAILYYLSINNGQAYKIGITNRTIEERFTASDLELIKVIKIWEYPIGQDAYKQEQRILKLHKDNKYSGVSLLSSGNTELFNFDVLGLDSIVS